MCHGEYGQEYDQVCPQQLVNLVLVHVIECHSVGHHKQLQHAHLSYF